MTTTRDSPTATTDVLTYADMVDAGQMMGPRVYSTGPDVGFWAYNITSLDPARSVLKQYSEYYNTQTAYTPTLLVAYGGPWAENYYYATEDVQGDAKSCRRPG